MSVSVPSGYRQGFVVLEDEPRLPALLPEDDRRWNGFAMPLFDPAIFEVEANRKILEQMFPKDPTNEDALILTWFGNTPSIVDPQYVYEADCGEYVSAVTIDGVKLWSIGNGAFVWSEWEVEDEDDEAPADVTQVDVVREVREAYATPLLADAIRELDAACVEHGVDGFDGEAVSYLSALLIMAEHGHSAEDALVTAYGLKALPKAGA